MDKKLFKNRAAWRKWLDEHHATARELWLVYYKKHTGKRSVLYEEAVEEALCYGWIDSQIRRLDDETYMQKYTPRKPGSNWAKSNKERVDRLSREGRMTPAGMAAITAAKQDGSWEKLDDIEEDPTVPPDLADALEKNPTAQRNFEGFAPSYRKQYLWWLGSAKRDETRKKRLLELVERCEQGVKPGM